MSISLIYYYPIETQPTNENDMKITINCVEIESIPFEHLKSGSLFTDPEKDNSPLYIKTNEGESIDLLTGEHEDLLHPEFCVIDVTDKYVIVDL